MNHNIQSHLQEPTVWPGDDCPRAKFNDLKHILAKVRPKVKVCNNT